MEDMRESDCWYLETCKEKSCYMCNTYLQLKWQMDNCGLPKVMQSPITMYNVNDEDTDAYKRLSDIRKGIVDFVNAGNNLYLCSENTGNGKTSWAVRMLHTYLHYTAEGNYEHLKGMFVSVTDLLIRLKDFQHPLSSKYKEDLQECDLVIWDDIAITGVTQYDYTQLYTVINNRIFSGRSNIFTGNIVTKTELKENTGERLATRIWNTSEIIELKGKDIR